MVKQQIDMKIAIANFYANLTTNEGKPPAKFQQEFLKLMQEIGL